MVQVGAQAGWDVDGVVFLLVVLEERGQETGVAAAVLFRVWAKVIWPSVVRYLMLARRACQSRRVEQLWVSR
ncbi:hypothetical protein [Kineosporia sp. NBRC 101731]|uniref:hypothetical protein n=1 Tax=Kineosporia sp. NBRC 101731 TaxID=3032199 RepID=UPI00249FD56A|nr:hypothetical protein [Kineosporia sp. NBRC 101731]GLY29366.1 hypothetical protein Kisp02_27310 [Kineosporia sp. NBRC 101731]